jgi:hypothetical protein
MNLKLRVARATNHLEKITAMYESGLGFAVIGSFKNHDGFEGIMLGSKEAGYHLEFTCQKGHQAPLSNSAENLLVFYVPDNAQYELTCRKMLAAGFRQVKAHNPYWDKSGSSFEDIESYRIVISKGAWTVN